MVFALVNSFVRENMVIPSVAKKFDAFEVQKAVDALGPLRDDFDIAKKEATVTFQGRSFRIQYYVFEEKGSDDRNWHTSMRIGGADESIDLATLRTKDFMVAGGKNCLRFIQVSHHDFVELNGDKYHPRGADELGDVYFQLLRQLKEEHTSVDSLLCHSYGSVILHHLTPGNFDLLPSTLVFDRAYTSTWKVGRQILNPVVFLFVYFLAYMTGWATNPEESFYKSLEGCKGNNSLKDRRVVLIEAKWDYYFSGVGAFDSDFVARVSRCGMKAARLTLDPGHFHCHRRAHHAIPPVDLIVHSQVVTPLMEMPAGSDLAAAIRNSVFNYSGEE